VSQARFNTVVRKEIDDLLREAVLQPHQHAAIAELYPVTTWDWRTLGKWFLWFGALSTASGVLLLARDLVEFTLERAAALVPVLMVLVGWAGTLLRRRAWPRLADTLGLLAGFLLVAESFLLGAIHSAGLGHWPALLLVDLVILVPVAYALCNVQLLVLCTVLFFTWFGGVTGYASGWGAYWFGMSYPARFLAVSALTFTLAFGHWELETDVLRRWRGWSRVYHSFSLFIGEMALWLLSLFGAYGDMRSGHSESSLELWLFNVLWAVSNAVLFVVGARRSDRMFTGYAITYGVIQGYTVFFAHVAGHLGGILSSLITGVSALLLVMTLERKRRGARGE
jgi:hypothetical protein